MATESIYPAVQPSLDLNFAAGNFDPRITFSRASAATYYDGKTVAKAEENLLSSSNSTNLGATAIAIIANNAAAPDNTLTAHKIIATSSSGFHATYYAVGAYASGLYYTVSWHVKAAEYSLVAISDGGNGAFSAIFDLNSVTATAVNGANRSATITPLTAGWFRCSVTFTGTGAPASSMTVCGYPAGATINTFGAQYTGDGSSGIYIWGAQLEQRSQVTAYTPTTTQPITNYIPVLQTAPTNVPRIDHDPVTGECKGLLIEEQRANLVVRSEEFSSASWSKGGTSVEANVVVAPDGSLTGDLLVSSNAAGYIYPSSGLLSAAGGLTFTYSVHAKAGNVSSFALLVSSGSYQGNYDLSAGTASTASANTTVSITHVGNGWYRCSMTCASVQTAPYSELQIGRIASGKTLYIWGAQLEAAAFPTSYMKTEASQVTRAADSAQMTGANFSSWYRQDEGTLFAEASLYARRNSGFESIIQMSSGVNNNAISLGTQSDTSSVRGISNPYGSVACDIYAGTVQKDKQFKAAFSYATDNFAVSSSNVNPTTDTSGGVPTGLNRAFFGRETVFDSPFAGHIRRIAYYPKRLTNAQLQALTA